MHRPSLRKPPLGLTGTPVCRMRHTPAMSSRRFLGGALSVVCALSMTAATAEAKPKYLEAATYPGMTTFQCRTERDPDPPGPEPQRHRRHPDLPERGEGQRRPGRSGDLLDRLRRRGVRHPLQAEHGRDPPERQARHAERLGPAPPPRRLARAGRAGRPSPRARRRRSRRSRRATASRSAPTPTGRINQMIHDLGASGAARSTSPGRSTGSPRRPRRGPTSPTTKIQWLDVAGSRRSTRSSTPSAASTATGTASTSSPTRSRRIPPSPATRSARRSATSSRWVVPSCGRDARLRRRASPPGRHARRPPGRP